ncbi:MAG: transrane protein, partial [Aeromicrobium sp.]|nr:transrane protein [Aeromicrobium sp.]
MSSTPYPVTATAQLDPDVSRGLWLVKWILAIPHYLILLVLWATFAILSIVAFVSILFTGRYPRGIFDFNVGVMRWTWRVTFYAYGALGTDRYPPFTLADVPSYPAHLDVVYPKHLSRGLVLVKWWLLALPHYLVVAFFVGGGLFAVDATSQDSQPLLLGGGLVGVLVIVAAVVLLTTGTYPKSIFDLVIGLQRWVIRVAGYAALMTDSYPPFRLDQGGGADDAVVDDAPTGPTPDHQGAEPSPARPVVPFVIGGLALVVATVLVLASAALLVADRTLPDKDGFLMTPDMTYQSESYAITSEAVDLGEGRLRQMAPDDVFGDAKLIVSSNDDGPPLFVGVGPTADVEGYLDDVARSTLLTVEMMDGRNEPRYRESAGGAPATEPGRQNFWTDSAEGRGERSISFPVESGSWTVVVMRLDGSRGVSADIQAGATFPAIGWLVAL